MEEVKKFLQSKNIKVPDDWLEQCVDYLHIEFKNLSQAELLDLVFQQWLTADLKELEFTVFPNCITKANRFVLNGKFCVQLNSIFDASVSAYSRMQKKKNTENANAYVTAEEEEKKPWEHKAKRMLVLELTDGVQNVRAMEYQSIPVLNSDLAPGTKILLKGRMECRKGMLMLTSENVEVMGGYAENLAETQNHDKSAVMGGYAENLAETQNHGKSTVMGGYAENLAETQNHSKSSGKKSQTKPPGVAACSEPFLPPPPKKERFAELLDDDFDIDLQLVDIDGKKENIPDMESTNFDDSDVVLLPDDYATGQPNNVGHVTRKFDDDCEIDILYESSNSIVEKQKITGQSIQSVGRAISDFDDCEIDIDYESLNNLTEPEKIPQPTIFDDDGNILLPEAYGSQSSSFGNSIGHVTANSGDYEIDVTYDPSNGIDLKFRSNLDSYQVQERPNANLLLVKLCTLLPDTQTPSMSRLCTVKAAVLHTISHLKLNDGERWSYVAKVTDGTASLDCELSNELLSQIIGMTASEALAVKNSSSELAKVEAIERVKKAAAFVQSFNGLMQIETKFKYPSIIRSMKSLSNQEMKSLEKTFCTV